MYLCYLDESGSAETYTQAHPASTPAFVLVGVSVAAARQKSLAMEFVRLKQQFEPHLAGSRLTDVIRHEVKGSALRADLRRTAGQRNRRRRAVGFIDKTIGLLEDHGCRLMGKVVIKQHDRVYRDGDIYPRAVADVAATFNSQLGASGTQGVMILDARTKVKNEGNVHTITTRRFAAGGDQLPHLVEAPVFGHSDTHLPLQIADVIASAVIFPSACLTYCEADTWSAHHSERYSDIKERFGARVARLEARYVDEQGATRGGFHVLDPVNRRPTHLLFRD